VVLARCQNISFAFGKDRQLEPKVSYLKLRFSRESPNPAFNKVQRIFCPNPLFANDQPIRQ
jgi:hypothetical protein